MILVKIYPSGSGIIALRANVSGFEFQVSDGQCELGREEAYRRGEGALHGFGSKEPGAQV
jgi:hypothetical protein